MKEIAGSIVVLAGSIILIAAEYFDSMLFWIIGGIMLLDGYILFTTSVLFPEWLTNWLKNIKENPTKSNQSPESCAIRPNIGGAIRANIDKGQDQVELQ